MSKIVVTNVEVKQAIKAMGRRTMTAYRCRRLIKQLKAEKLAEAMVQPQTNLTDMV